MIFNRFIQTFSGKTQICASAVFLTSSIKHDFIFCSLKNSEHLFLAFHFPAAGTLAHGNLILRLHSLLLPEPVALLLQELPLKLLLLRFLLSGNLLLKFPLLMPQLHLLQSRHHHNHRNHRLLLPESHS